MSKTTRNTIFIKSYSIILFLLLPIVAMAQSDFWEDDTDDVAPAAPIDDYIPVLMLVGFYFAYRFYKKQGLLNRKN
jgi:predicted secreted protein